MMQRQFQALERRDFRTFVRENALLLRRPWYNWLVQLKLWIDSDRLATGFRDPALILRDYRQLFGPDFQKNAEYCSRIVAPTIVIGGTADQLFDRTAFEETADLISGARMKLFESETHMLPAEKSSEVAGVIRDFLDQA
jgi:pimeloyl-ACP methyl ester carboxylesterase